MGFYGNITNVNKSTFQFDKTYSNRAEMDENAASDGIFVGRYVLVDYDQGSTVASIIQELEEEYSVDITDANFVIAYKRMWYSENEGRYLNELDKYNQVILQPSVSEEPDAERYGIEDGVIINDKTFALVIGAIKIKETLVTDEETGASDVVVTHYLDLDITPEVYYCTKGEEKSKRIAGYELEKDESGNPVYRQVTDAETGEPVWEVDEEGNQVLDEENNPIPVLEPVYALDENGEKIPVYETDEEGKPIEDVTTYLKTELITDLVAPSGLYKNVYVANYNRDASTYGKSIGRGWDSTVWQKTYKDGKYEYVMIAELNSVVPTFDITVDAPTETPLKPHYDADTSNLYYKIHFQPSWGMRLKAAGGDASIDAYSLDKKQYPSDLTGRFVTDSEVKYDEGSEHHVINKEVKSAPLAVYFDKKSFDKYWDSEVYPIQDGERFIPAEDGIYFTPSGYSGNQYYAHQTTENGDIVEEGSETMKVKYPDTYELSIMLPSIGQSISQMWDIIYGVGGLKDSAGNYLWDKYSLAFADKDNGTLIRNTDIRWNSKLGLRSLDYPKGYPNEEFDSLAGAINSVHDLMGMIIIAPKAPTKGEAETSEDYTRRFSSWYRSLLSPAAVAEWDPTKIYEIPVYEIINDEPTIVGQKFYRKSKEYNYNDNYASQQDLIAHINEEDFVEANVIDVRQGDYYRLDAAQLPKYYDEDGAGAKELSGTLYNNYISVNENSPVYEGAIYGTINFYDKNVVLNEPKPVELSAEDYVGNTLYYRTKEEGVVPAGSNLIAYKLDTNGLPSAADGVYYKLTVGESTEDKKFYYPNLYYLGLVKTPNPQEGWSWDTENEKWVNDKEDWSSADFDSVSLCTEDSLTDILMRIPANGTSDTTYGYKFFEGVDVTIEETDTLIEDEYNPILRRNVIGEYNSDLESGRRDIVIYTKDDTNNKIERARYIYNTETDTWDFTFKYNIVTDLETGDSYGQFNPNGTKTYIEQIPNSEAFVDGSILSLYTYLCTDSPSILSGFTLAEIVAQTDHHLTLKEDGTPKIIYRLIRKKVSIYNFDNAKTVNLEDFDISSNYYYNTYINDQNYMGGDANYETWAADHNGNYQYWIQETMSGSNIEERLKNTVYYKISAEKTAVYYNLAQGYYYKDAYDNYVKETVIRMKPSVNNPESPDYKRYYRFIDQNDTTGTGFKFIPITAEPFIENKFYYKPEANGPYILATHYEDGVTYYKRTNALYVKSTEQDFLQVGAEWNKAVNTLPAGVALSHREESWGYEELPEFAERYNTINGLILNLYKKLLPNDTLTRDLTTVQGSINTLNDIIDKFDELVPAEIVMIDEYGRVHSGDWRSDQSLTAINYGFNTGGVTLTNIVDKTEQTYPTTGEQKTADAERWINIRTDSGNGTNFKPRIHIEHALNHRAVPTTTYSDKNLVNPTLPNGYTAAGLNQNTNDTLQLYTPIVDNMGHIIGNNTETVTLPYGFKSIATNCRASNNNQTDISVQNNIVADNTQDTLGINSGNEWIRIETDPTNDIVTIYHDAKNVGKFSTEVNLSRESDENVKIDISEDSFDDTNHLSSKTKTTYTLPNSYGKFTGDNKENNALVVSEATATHDTFSITGDTWITTTVSKDSIALTHTDAHTATTSVGESNSSYQFGSTFQVLNVGIDDKGHVKNLSTHNVTIPQGGLTDATANGADVITQLSFDKPTGMLTSTRTNIGTLALTGYSLNNNGSSEAAISAADTLNTALQRIEYRLNKEITDRETVIDSLDSSYTAAGAIMQTGITSASTVNAIAKIDIINGKATGNSNDNKSVLVDAAGAAAAAKSELLGTATDTAETNTIFGLKALIQQTATNANAYADGLAENYDPAGAATTAEENAIAAISTTEFTYSPLVANPEYDSSDPTSEEFIRDETQSVTKTIGDWITYIMDKFA